MKGATLIFCGYFPFVGIMETAKGILGEGGRGG